MTWIQNEEEMGQTCCTHCGEPCPLDGARCCMCNELWCEACASEFELTCCPLCFDDKMGDDEWGKAPRAGRDGCKRGRIVERRDLAAHVSATRDERMKKRKRKIMGTIRITAPRSSVILEQDELYQLMKPVLTAVSEYNTSSVEKALEKWEEQREGVLAWGVRSGYFLWVRANPGKIPTMPQVYAWLKIGGLL